MRRAISLGFDNEDYIRQIFKGNGVAAQSPIVPGTFGYDPQWRTGMSEYSPAKAKALLDTYGYIDRNGDGWREQPDGSPLVLEKARSPAEIDRRQSEQWRRYMTAIGLKIEFSVAQWPELVKQSLAGTLMIWNFAWQAQEPDSELFFSLAYGPNKGSANDARFSLKAYDEFYERQRVLARWARTADRHARRDRLLVAYMPYKFHLHRIQQDLAQPWLIGYRRHPFTTRTVGVSRCRQRRLRAAAGLTMLGSNPSDFVVADHRARDSIGGVVHRSRSFALDRSRDWRAASIRDPCAAARHRVHHRRTDRSGGPPVDSM